MLAALLLVAAAQDLSGPNALSPALEALVAARGTLAPEEFVRRVETLARGGDASAAELAGEASLRGDLGWPRDPARACDWFEKASTKRGDAAHDLALCYETGNGRPQNLARARALYAGAIPLGFVQSKCALGTMLVSGRGGPRDVQRGMALCREAAEAGNANAQTDYAGWLLTGELVPADFVAARRWLTAAAEQGQVNAAFLLGQMHWNGDGGPKDPDEGVRWWKRAYEGGRKDAAAMLARAAFKRAMPDGKTVTDREAVADALHWMRIAAAEDPNPEARRQYAEIARNLGGGD